MPSCVWIRPSKRIPIINPDLTGGSVRVVEDPAVKGATKMTLYIDRAINDGAKST